MDKVLDGAHGPAWLKKIPSEVGMTAAVVLVVFGVVATGSAISSAVGGSSPWLFAASYAGPAALAYGVYWLASRRR
ncbi:hypothetical protein ACO2Q3_16290 [Caulobacter sp. KR2-114]|uniref:hypothetical protein n=1 Tax=Caulobacter sp. KR2-114 TaxID=3400912 RepID=UPI003C05B2E6